MASLDLDPMFRRGLRLLHSRSRDSTEQLKALVDEAVRQRQGKSIPPMTKVSQHCHCVQYVKLTLLMLHVALITLEQCNG